MTGTFPRLPGSEGGSTVQINLRSSPTFFEVVLARLDAEGYRYFTGAGLDIGNGYRSVIVDATHARNDLDAAGTPVADGRGGRDGSSVAERMESKRWRYWNCTGTYEAAWLKAADGEARESVMEGPMVALTEASPVLSMAMFLTTPDVAGDRAVGVQQAMLTAWWTERMSEGHTVESARLLLALTMTPGLAENVQFEVGGPRIIQAGRDLNEVPHTRPSMS